MAEEVMGTAGACGLFRQGQYDEPSVHCPCCGEDYTHIESVATRVGSDAWEAGAYTGATPAGTTEERRSALVVTFSCEYGHRFALVIQQHKGNNLVTVEVYPDNGPTADHFPEEFRAEWAARRAEAAARLLKHKAARLRLRAAYPGEDGVT